MHVTTVAFWTICANELQSVKVKRMQGVPADQYYVPALVEERFVVRGVFLEEKSLLEKESVPEK